VLLAHPTSRARASPSGKADYVKALANEVQRGGIAAWKALRDLVPQDEDISSGSPSVSISQCFVAAYKEINRLELQSLTSSGHSGAKRRVLGAVPMSPSAPRAICSTVHCPRPRTDRCRLGRWHIDDRQRWRVRRPRGLSRVRKTRAAGAGRI
jgi:hypothetical protein